MTLNPSLTFVFSEFLYNKDKANIMTNAKVLDTFHVYTIELLYEDINETLIIDNH